jgi:hypothetical protein
MGSDSNRRQWARSHIEGLYFLGKGGILPNYQSVQCRVKCAPDSSNRLQRPCVHDLTLDVLDRRCPVVVSDGWLCLIFARAARHTQNLFLAEGFSLVFTNTHFKDDYLNETYVTNPYVDRAFVLNLGRDVRIHLQPDPSERWAHTVPSGGRRLFH